MGNYLRIIDYKVQEVTSINEVFGIMYYTPDMTDAAQVRTMQVITNRWIVILDEALNPPEGDAVMGFHGLVVLPSVLWATVQAVPGEYGRLLAVTAFILEGGHDPETQQV